MTARKQEGMSWEQESTLLGHTPGTISNQAWPPNTAKGFPGSQEARSEGKCSVPSDPSCCETCWGPGGPCGHSRPRATSKSHCQQGKSGEEPRPVSDHRWIQEPGL